MAVEESLSKKLYKIELFLLKTLPMAISVIYIANSILSYFNIDIEALSYIIFGMLMAFLYISSYVFKFCEYHRMFLHFIVVSCIINTVDLYYNIPINNEGYLALQMGVAGIFLFIILYLKRKSDYEKSINRNNS